jgi:hypothetical protein
VTLSCTLCASPEVMAVAPGSEPERIIQILVDAGAPMVSWCWACWVARYADGAIAARPAGAT